MQKQRRYKVDGSLINIHSILSNLVEYGNIHPLIRRVNKIIESNGDSQSSYQIIERPYSWIPVNISYQAKVVSSNEKVEYQISDIPFSKADIVYDLNSVDTDYTEIIFTLRIHSIFIVRQLLMYKMLMAQDQLMNSIGKYTAKSIVD